MLTHEEILQAKERYLFSEKELYVLPDTEGPAYCFSFYSLSWSVRDNASFWHVWDCDPALYLPVSGDAALSLIDDWRNQVALDNSRLEKAITFAVDHHAGQFRKGTVRPYIMHPLETMQILNSMNADINLLIAGVLHDTIEDTEATAEGIREVFGDDVAALISANSEDKSKTWDERKKHTIDNLAKASKRVKMLIMADKVSNLRSLAADYSQIGKELWKRFNAPAEKQAWYYGSIQDALYDMQDYPECAPVYWEMVGLYKDIFVRFYCDMQTARLYQVCIDGTSYMMEKGNPEWKPFEGPLSETAESMNRIEAEKTEDAWNALFWQRHETDIADSSYNVYASKRRSIEFRLSGSKLTLACEDYGPESSVMSGDDEYEFYYELDEASTHRFFVRLRIEYGLETDLAVLLKGVFGTDDGTTRFTDFCMRNSIKPKFIAI